MRVRFLEYFILLLYRFLTSSAILLSHQSQIPPKVVKGLHSTRVTIRTAKNVAKIGRDRERGGTLSTESFASFEC